MSGLFTETLTTKSRRRSDTQAALTLGGDQFIARALFDLANLIDLITIYERHDLLSNR